MEKLIALFLRSNGYYTQANDVRLQILSHPNFPSLKSITDTFDYFGIESVAATVPKEALEELPSVFLALLEEPGDKDNIAIVYKKRNNKIRLQYNARRETLSTAVFKEKWTGTVIAIDKIYYQKDKHLQTFRRVVMAIILSFIGIQAFSFHWTLLLLSLLSIIGIGLSYFIALEEIGVYDKTIAGFCGAVGKGNDCADVIKSPEGKLFNTFALSDLCVAFFVGSILMYTLVGFNYIFSLLAAALSIPIVFFSLHRQAVILKQWCALCLGIVAVLIAQMILVATTSWMYDMSFIYFLKALFIMALVYVVWERVKPLWADVRKLNKTEEEFMRFRRNESLFRAALHRERLSEETPMQPQNEICFGVRNPLVKIDIVTNPLCGFCTAAFDTYHKIMTIHGDKILLNLVFNAPFDSFENPATRIAMRVLEVYYTNGSDSAFEALVNWFRNKDIRLWEARYGESDIADIDMVETLKDHREWCVANKLLYTPATVINGYIYPKEYPTPDLLFFIDGILAEQIEKRK